MSLSLMSRAALRATSAHPVKAFAGCSSLGAGVLILVLVALISGCASAESTDPRLSIASACKAIAGLASLREDQGAVSRVDFGKVTVSEESTPGPGTDFIEYSVDGSTLAYGERLDEYTWTCDVTLDVASLELVAELESFEPVTP